ncbi:hypothetical protein [Hymenobacter canadensis]|uniref:Phage integrase SAM-like domain-containing protein n=1 Tax=Hymenobacter canadensis TaxID=2999067 RepID=A0ABY7LLR0_9BACT|nr:hypothetical protein [Hymenobacter canadensis]WBA41389.1 hypothetical protein O3303_16405 [Hymenobacter canadensis]
MSKAICKSKEASYLCSPLQPEATTEKHGTERAAKLFLANQKPLLTFAARFTRKGTAGKKGQRKTRKVFLADYKKLLTFAARFDRKGTMNTAYRLFYESLGFTDRVQHTFFEWMEMTNW